MNSIEFLARQTEDAYSWVHKLTESIPHEKWSFTPEIVETNVSWQVGHLIVSYYYHSIVVITGHQMDILQQMPMKLYADLFNSGSPKQASEKISPDELLSHLKLMEQKSLETIRALPAESLKSSLEPGKKTHPVAKTKFEALDWNIKHTMWHCGQLGMLKRIVHERYDFG